MPEHSSSSSSDSTPASLLERLRHEGEAEAWSRFVRLYTPLLFYWAQQANLTEHDAADLVQDVFASLLERLPAFTYRKDGSFRSWLRTVTLNKLRDSQRRQSKSPKTGLVKLPEQSLPDHVEAFWEGQYRSELIRRALELMKTDFAETTWKACWECVVRERPIVDVAAELGVSTNAVYISKFRVLQRLRHELDGLLD